MSNYVSPPPGVGVNAWYDLSKADQRKVSRCFSKHFALYCTKFPHNMIVHGPVRMFTRSDIEAQYQACFKKHRLAAVFFISDILGSEAWIIGPHKDWTDFLKEVDEVLAVADMIDIVEK